MKMAVMNLSKIFNIVMTVVVSVSLISIGFWVHNWVEQTKVLNQVIERLSAETQIADVLVTKSEYDEKTGKIKTTIKFLEYDHEGDPLTPQYFAFHGNIIQFESLVIRFEDKLVRSGDKLKGKSIALFMKAFVLDGENTQEFVINEAGQVPSGYRVAERGSKFEQQLWAEFWDYALKPSKRQAEGVKNAQIEAPGTMFLPGSIYTLHLEHDGGMRIDSRPVPQILMGEDLTTPLFQSKKDVEEDAA